MSKKDTEVLSGDWEDARKPEVDSDLSIRQAKFIEGLAKFGIESKALEFAGYRADDSKAAWRLKRDPQVKFAIETMKAQALERAVMGRVQLIEQTTELLKEARAAKQYTAVRGLNQDLAVLCGFGLRTGELESASESFSAEPSINSALFEANLRSQSGHVEWERGEYRRVIAEYEKMTGILVPMGKFEDTLRDLGASRPGAEFLKTCSGCGRPFEAEKNEKILPPEGGELSQAIPPDSKAGGE